MSFNKNFILPLKIILSQSKCKVVGSEFKTPTRKIDIFSKKKKNV